MAQIVKSGQKKTDVLNGKVRIEDGNQRLIAENDDGTTIILGKGKTGNYGISYYNEDGDLTSITTGESVTYYNSSGQVTSITTGDGTTYFSTDGKATTMVTGQLIKVAQTGYDVRTATDDQLVMSSGFNMHKIIAKGSFVATPRAGSVTLDSTNIGYRFQIIVNTGLASASNTLSGDLMLRVYNNQSYSDIADSGLFYDDGTNKAFYRYNYYILDGSIYVEFKVRVVAGSLSINLKNNFSQSLKWEICNNTQVVKGGVGSIGLGSGKYYFFDTISLNADGTTASALASSTVELSSAGWAYFPYSVMDA